MLRVNKLILLWTIHQLYQIDLVQAVYEQVHVNPWSAPIPPFPQIHNNILPRPYPSLPQIQDKAEDSDNSLPFEADTAERDLQDNNDQLSSKEQEEVNDVGSDPYHKDLASNSDYQFPKPSKKDGLFNPLQGLQALREFNQARYRDSMPNPRLGNRPDISMERRFNTRFQDVDDIPRPDNVFSKSGYGKGNLGDKYAGQHFGRPGTFLHLALRNSFKPVEVGQQPFLPMDFSRYHPQVTSPPLQLPTNLPTHQMGNMVLPGYLPNTPLWRTPLPPNYSPLRPFIPQSFVFNALMSPLQSGRILAVFDFFPVRPVPAAQRMEMLPFLPEPLPLYSLSDQFMRLPLFAPTPNRIIPQIDNRFIPLNIPELRVLLGSLLGTAVGPNRPGFQGFNRNFQTMQMGRSYNPFLRPMRDESTFDGRKAFPANRPMPFFPLPNLNIATQPQHNFQRQFHGQVFQNPLYSRPPQPFLPLSGMHHPALGNKSPPPPMRPQYFRAPFWAPRSPSSFNLQQLSRSKITLPPRIVMQTGTQMPRPGVNTLFPRTSSPYNPAPWLPNKSRLPPQNIPYPYGPNNAFRHQPRVPVRSFNPLLLPQHVHL